MTKWMKPTARNLCMIAILTISLAGCNDHKDITSEAVSTFPTVMAQNAVTPPISTGSAEEPVIGTVTAIPVPPTEPAAGPPVGGAAPESIAPPAENTAAADPLLIIDGGLSATKQPEATAVAVKEPEKVTRFVTTSPDTMENPTSWSSPVYEYDLGNLIASVGLNSSSFAKSNVIITPIRGWIRYPLQSTSPTPPSQYPLVVFLHGQHDWDVANFHGYDYLAENLSSHGYIVVSIDANAVNSEKVTSEDGLNGGGDQSSESRAQLVLGTLDRLRQINEHGQIDKNGNPGALNPLRGKIDFGHIGIMGHSRGGQGIANTIKFNKNRRGASHAGLVAALIYESKRFKTQYPDLIASFTPASNMAGISLSEAKFAAAINKYNIFYAQSDTTASTYDFKAAFLLAPTDFGGNEELNNVPLGVLLPTCDGDMANLQGAVSFDHNRFGQKGDKAPRYQILVHSANHNYYNTIWTQDDFVRAKKPADSLGPNHCLADSADSIRVSAVDQRRGGMFMINSFMRYHVGGEEKFASWWNGIAKLPDAACPFGRGPCDERVALTIQKNQDQSKLIQHFASADSDKINSLGGAVAYTGFDDNARCDMPSGSSNAGECSPKRLSGFEFEEWGVSGLRSIAEHVELSWTKAGATLTNDLLGISAAPHDTLSFRIAVVRPMGQEVLVTLTDGAGKSATIEASDFSDALYNAPRTKAEGRPMIDDPIDEPYSGGQVKILLNMVAIPLKAFTGIDLNNLKELKLTFPKESGKVALADIQFQTFGRDQFGPRLVAVKN
ncbi:hypothetical protein M8997_007720 [Phyllobacterium sp. 21LDTY02-6]|uniref:hypothetical protein n=1 Tax=Phyllobacterium sp. 21LDTY02-6 TaxID=2944903 RepID=UPI0020223BF9|nr:hypothetical protein [Phyllobacterium sp. 21LDTY02-6]MCO4317067.1 hypothetical protein [Phyllobacterium sp. 21LDTY02-6]